METKKTLNELLQDKDFVISACEAKDLNTFKELFIQNGVEIDDDAAGKAMEVIRENIGTDIEISEDELEEVSGGFWLSVAIGVGVGAVLGVALVKMYEHLNYPC